MTKPTRQQERGGELLAEALLAIAEAGLLDGRSTFGEGDLREVIERLARASSAFSADEIVARAIERRGRALGMRAGVAELITLMDDGAPPHEMLLLADDEFRARVEAIDAELGDIS